MADTKISDMTAAVTAADADLVPIVQGGVNKKATVDLILDALTAARVATAIGSTAANLVYAGPASGAAAVPAARSLVADDIPASVPMTKLAALTIDRALVSSGAGVVSVSAVTATELGYVSGVTSAIQTQLTAKADASALNASNLTSGTVPDARFPATLPAASGVNLTALNATQLTSGTVPDARFPAVLPAISGANLTNLPGGISGLTTGAIPYATSGTAIADSPLVRVDANTIAQRNSTTVQSFDVYGTYTDASNYERLRLTYTSGVAAWDIKGEAAGTGSARHLRFTGFSNGFFEYTGTVSLGIYYPLVVSAGFPPNCYLRPGADVMDLGGPSNQWVDSYIGKSYQGGRSKAISDAADQSFVRIACATADTAVSGHINYSIHAYDSTGHSVECQTGTLYFVVRNQNGTVTATPDGTGHEADVKRNIGSIGVCTFKTSIATTNCDFVINADTTLTTTGYTIWYHVVIASGTATITSL